MNKHSRTALLLALALPVALAAQGVQVRTAQTGQIPENPAKILEIAGAPGPERTVVVRQDDDANRILASWDERPAAVARQVMAKYGKPDETTASRLIWYNHGPWKRTEVTNDLVKHDVPSPHLDMLTQVIRYQTPADAADDLMKFHPGITIDRARGELSVRCQDEKTNMLVVNLADEVARRARTADDARQFFARAFDSGDRQYIAYKEGLRLPVASVAP